MKYALINIINSLLTIVLVLLFFFVFKRGVEGLFVGNILSRFLSISIIELPRRKVVSNLSLRSVKKEHIKEILNYSIPLLITSVAFGIIASPGKFIVKYFYGYELNGILAGAQKYMTIIIVLGTTFYQAWQVTAVKNYQEHGSEKFFSDVFNKYVVVLCLLVLCVSFGLRSFPFLIGPEFHQSINLIYIYCISSVFLCLAWFFDIIYQCTKQTKKLLYSIVSCAAFAPLITFGLTKYFGVMGSLIALTISYAYLFIYRYFQTKNALPIRLKKEFLFSVFGLITGCVLFYFIQNRVIDATIFSLASLLLFYFLFDSRKYITK